MYQEWNARLAGGRPLPRVRTASGYLMRALVVAMVVTPIAGLVGGLLGLPFMFVTYEAGDPVTLRFLIGRGRSSRTIEVPVPRGREAEAIYLTQSLTSK